MGTGVSLSSISFHFLLKFVSVVRLASQRFHVGRVHIIVTATDFHVFVSKAEKQMAELVNINLGCMEITGNADTVMVIDGSTTIFLHVGNNVDEVIGDVSG